MFVEVHKYVLQDREKAMFEGKTKAGKHCVPVQYCVFAGTRFALETNSGYPAAGS